MQPSTDRGGAYRSLVYLAVTLLFTVPFGLQSHEATMGKYFNQISTVCVCVTLSSGFVSCRILRPRLVESCASRAVMPEAVLVTCRGMCVPSFDRPQSMKNARDDLMKHIPSAAQEKERRRANARKTD